MQRYQGEAPAESKPRLGRSLALPDYLNAYEKPKLVAGAHV